MQLKIQKPTIKATLNRMFRRTQRVVVNVLVREASVDTLNKNVTVQREIYANKEVIKVFANIDTRCMGRI